MEIDASLYPDEEPPSNLTTMEDRADYLHRVASAFDFGVAPEEPTLRLLEGWKDVFDRFPMHHSPAYHALRAFYGWEEVARTHYFDDPGYRKLDAAEDRVDGCENRV